MPDQARKSVETVSTYSHLIFEEMCQELTTKGYKLLTTSCEPDPNREMVWAAIFVLPGVTLNNESKS